MDENSGYHIVYKSQIQAPLAIVVLAHNGMKITQEFLHFLFANTPDSSFCLFMIDNASSDGTQELLIKTLANKKNSMLVLSQKNLGVAGGRNLGHKICEELGQPYEYMMFLDNDQYLLSGWLQQYMAIMEHDYDVVGVEAWQMTPIFFPAKKITNLSESFSYVGGGGEVIRKEVFNKIGVLDEQFSPAYYEDPDFAFRAYDAGLKIGWNIKARIHHVGHQTLGKNTQLKQQMFTSSWKKFRQKWGNRKPPNIFQADLPEFR